MSNTENLREERDHLRHTLQRLHRLGENMRDLQNEYFKTRSGNVLRLAKAAEKDFDDYLQKLKHRPIETTKEYEQGALFAPPAKKKQGGFNTEGY